jgi:hypothetical protein
MSIVLKATLDIIIVRLGFPLSPIVICTDSFSLYKCLVKLGTTKGKRLMIDIMALRQSHERRELAEIRWINGKDNPADAMTKEKPNKALETIIRTNELNMRVERWVHRTRHHHIIKIWPTFLLRREMYTRCMECLTVPSMTG